MKIRVLSDLHLEHHMPPSIPRVPADLVILAGDIANGRDGIDWAARTFDCPVVYVPGNHEYYDSSFERAAALMAEAAAAHHGIHLLDSTVATFALPHQRPVRVLGATWWADYTLFGRERRDAAMAACANVMLDHRLIQTERDGAVRRFAPADALALHEAASAWLAHELDQPFDGHTIVVTHHAPDLGSLDPRYAHDLASAGFVSRRPDLVARADLWVHGHTHTSFDYWIDDSRVLCNPRGYVRRGDGALENPRFDWGCVVEV